MTTPPHDTHSSVSAAHVTPSKRDPISDWLDVFIRMLSLSKADSISVRDELEDHLRSRVDDLLIIGSSEHDAVRRAVSELGETADLARRFKQASHPSRRRTLMSTALIAIAGSALTLGAFSVFAPPPIITTTTGFAGSNGVAAFVAQPGEAAPFDESLKKYNIAVFYAEDLEGRWGEMHPEHRTRGVVNTIQNLVSPTLWIDLGGNEASINITGNTMFIRGPQETHAGVEWVLETLIADLESERRGYLEQIERRKAERKAEAEANRVRQAQSDIEQRRWHRQAMAEAEANRIQQIEELRTQYENLTMQYVELTRELAQHEMEQERLDVLRVSIQFRAQSQFADEQIDLQRQHQMLKNSQTSIKSHLNRLRSNDSSDETAIEQAKSQIEEVEVAMQANSNQQAKVLDQINVVVQADYKDIVIRISDFRAREAELSLSYEDTEARLDRIRSMLLDLEMAQYDSAYAPVVNSSGVPSALYTPYPAASTAPEPQPTGGTVTLTGDVARPGKFNLPTEGTLTVERLIAGSGLLTDASLSQVRIKVDLADGSRYEGTIKQLGKFNIPADALVRVTKISKSVPADKPEISS